MEGKCTRYTLPLSVSSAPRFRQETLQLSLNYISNICFLSIKDEGGKAWEQEIIKNLFNYGPKKYFKFLIILLKKFRSFIKYLN